MPKKGDFFDHSIKHSKKDENVQAEPTYKESEVFVTEESESLIDWSNLIFLPFHPVFRMFILFCVFVKVLLGPIQSIYPVVHCYDVMDHDPFLIFIKYFYWYCCDFFYGLDTFLHIAHRQVTDKAMRREHVPKSAKLLFCDLAALIPFFRLIEVNPCPKVQIWPNILANNEFLVIYRVTQYFQLLSTHSYWKLMIGYTLVLGICLNCLTCFWLLLSAYGFCERCRDANKYYDWRASILSKLNETSEAFTTYVYGFVFVYSFSLNSFYDNECKPSAILEFIIICMFMVAGYILNNFIVFPKVFTEAIFRLRKICYNYPKVQKIIQETKRRNPSNEAHLKVENHYKLLWRKRGGVSEMPSIFRLEIPQYLRLEIMQDLLWPLYYHSPTLRKTSFSFRRWISEGTIITYKLPGEKFYSCVQDGTHLYYVKSGVVQLISIDDGVTPILSVTGGTVFGDINFLVPHMKRKVLVRCLTYCEIYYVPRKFLIKGIQQYPEDRRVILEAKKQRLRHARALFVHKQQIKGLDRQQDEGIAWIKRRWWEISDYIERFSKLTGKSKTNLKVEIPHEELVYHCAKYIGQLALCTSTQLKTKSLFINFKFPWILNPISKVGLVWNQIISGNVMLVLLLYPPNLIKPEIPEWFIYFSHWTDTMYILDITISLFTAMKISTKTSFVTVLMEHWKSFTFMLDILATIWIEDIANIVGRPQYYYTLQFNRLIKVYILFHTAYLHWDIRKNPFIDVCNKICLIHLSEIIIISHVVFEMTCYIPTVSMAYFFGQILCSKTVTTDCEDINPYAGVTISWAFEWTFAEYVHRRLIDAYLGVVVSYISHIVIVYCKGKYTAYLYLKNRETTSYQSFVMHLKDFYQHYRLHKDLVKRLDRYFTCHWKYFHGTDVMFSNSLKREPYEVYWKAQGNVARKIICESTAFSNADPALIKELACAGKFLLMPKLANILMFGAQCKNVTWIIQGYVKSEYCNDEGEVMTEYYGPGSLLSVSAVFFGRASVKSYSAYTDCEILYIPVNNFFNIYKGYSLEYSYLETCLQEYGSRFDDMFQHYLLKHKENRSKVRDRLLSSRMSVMSTVITTTDVQENRSSPFEGEFWGEPESIFLQSWLLFRSIIAVLSIMSASILGGVGAGYRRMLIIMSAFCDTISWCDITLKLFLPYYDDKGIFVTSKKKCLLNYMSKGFALDVIGALPWHQFMKYVLSADIDHDSARLLNTMFKFSHIYTMFAYFDYITDVPTVNITYIMIIKWQIVNILIVMGSSHYLILKCIKFTHNEKFELIRAALQDTCWMPDFSIDLPDLLSWHEMQLIFANSLNLAECGMLSMNFGRFIVDREHLGIGLTLFILGIIFWFISCYTLILLVLNARGDTLFQYKSQQLKNFLVNERIEKPVIEKVMEHLRYYWIRTKGINLHQLTNDRIGVVFQQDLNYYFYKKTLTLMDSLIKGGEAVQRQIANSCTQEFFLPGSDIFREMDLVTHICIVHRGRVIITRNEKRLIVLSKGDIFGQLTGKRLRAIQVTATSEDRVDLLYIDFKVFQSIATDDVKRNIRRNPQHKKDYIASKNKLIENPYDTVQYILRGHKTIKLPWNHDITEAHHGTRYSDWLHLTWIIGPFLSTALVLLFYILPTNSGLWLKIYYALIVLDILHLLNFISEFYTIELTVQKNKCAYQRVGTKILKTVNFYIDALTLIMPPITLLTGHWEYQIARFMRLKFFYDFEVHFCRSFKNTFSPVLLKFAILLLLLHGFACGWIYFGCRGAVKYPERLRNYSSLNDTLDFTTWTDPEVRGEGCARATRNILPHKTSILPSFVVSKFWEHDYVLAMTFILLIHTHTSIDSILAVSLSQVYYKVFVTFVMYLIDVYIMAFAVNTAYAKFREMYQYDFSVNNLLLYLSDCGLCKSLVEAVLQYTGQLWQRQKGDKLPAIAYQAPPCLRQDLFTALYIHHLDAAPTFRNLPFYFKRQLAARLQRIVIFPGKCIIREGDTFNTTYFIHEGEVEKWYIDENGDSRMLSVLYTNGYFGCVAGLIGSSGFQFSYYTRTVVDLIYLNLKAWDDLLEAYPEIKAKLLESAHHLTKAYGAKRWTKSTSISGLQSSTDVQA